VKERLIEVGESLYARETYRATAFVLSNGKLEYKNLTSSIHRIGAIIQQTPSCNSWKFWHVMRNDTPVLIDDLKNECLRKKELAMAGNSRL
jgi:modification methylase